MEEDPEHIGPDYAWMQRMLNENGTTVYKWIAGMQYDSHPIPMAFPFCQRRREIYDCIILLSTLPIYLFSAEQITNIIGTNSHNLYSILLQILYFLVDQNQYFPVDQFKCTGKRVGPRCYTLHPMNDHKYPCYDIDKDLRVRFGSLTYA